MVTQSILLVEALRAKLEAQYPHHDFRWRGRRGLCPEHPDTKPSLVLYPDGAFCFGCRKYFPLRRAEPDPKAKERMLLGALAEHLQSELAAHDPEAEAARRWLGKLCDLDERWLTHGARAGERTVGLPLGYCRDRDRLLGVARAKAEELGLPAERVEELLRPAISGSVVFVYEAQPGLVSGLKFRPVGAGSEEARFTRDAEGIFGLGLLEPELFDRGVVLVEGESDALAIQALALRRGELRPVLAAGGCSRFAKAVGLIERLEPEAKVYIWPDRDRGGIEAVGALLDEIEGVIWPEGYAEDQDPRAFIAALEPPSVGSLDKAVREGKREPLAWSKAVGLDQDLEAWARVLPHTDLGQAELLVKMAGDRLRHDHKRGRWLFWTGSCWEPDADGEVERLAYEAARLRQRAARAIPDEKGARALEAFGRRCESHAKVTAVLNVLKALRPVADPGEGWDQDPWLLGVRDGVLDLRTGELIEPRPEQRITLQTGAPYNPEAECPRWLQFLDEIFLGDQELIDFVHRAVGYSLTGSTVEQCLFICYGTGANGKSTFLNVLRHVLGDYAANTPFSTFDYQRKSEIPNDLAALVGKRLVTSFEVKEHARLDESRVKALTGGDPITARFLHREFFTYTPQFKIWLAVNHKPNVSDTSHGFWRRVRLIPFEAKFEGERADKQLEEKLRAEATGILAWAVRGCLAWQERGLEPPEKVREATEAYRVEQDVLSQFIDECCVVADHAWVRASDLYARYKAWAEENGLPVLSSTKFGTQLMERGFRKTRDRRGRIYLGIGLLDEERLEF